MATDVPDGRDGLDGLDGRDELDGASAAAVADGSASPAPVAASGRPGLLAVVAGALCLVYVIWYILDLVVLSADPATFNAAHDAADTVVVRLVFAVLFLAIAYHGLDGIRRTTIDFRPRWATHDAGLRAAVAFLTMAVSIPVAMIVVWPSVQAWRS